MKIDRFKTPFWTTLLWKQNKWHYHGVIGHTLKVVWHVVKKGRWDMIPAAFLHDIAKPVTAYRDDEDKITGDFSFTNHERLSYEIIKKWPVSDFTKDVVRYHYHIRGMANARKKGKIGKYNRYKREWDKLDNKMKRDLGVFLAADDAAKKKGF